MTGLDYFKIAITFSQNQSKHRSVNVANFKESYVFRITIIEIG